MTQSQTPNRAIPTSGRELARQVLREAGLLTELGPHLRERVDAQVCLDDVIKALGRAGDKPLSQIILEQRGTKV